MEAGLSTVESLKRDLVKRMISLPLWPIELRVSTATAVMVVNSRVTESADSASSSHGLRMSHLQCFVVVTADANGQDHPGCSKRFVRSLTFFLQDSRVWLSV